MQRHTVALFGEAEKGNFHVAHRCESLEQLVESLGNPPPYSRGLYMAVQAVMYGRLLLFFRVEEEGFSLADYYRGLRMLVQKTLVSDLTALCVPGVGDKEIIHLSTEVCHQYDSILIANEQDLYDYLTS